MKWLCCIWGGIWRGLYCKLYGHMWCIFHAISCDTQTSVILKKIRYWRETFTLRLELNFLVPKSLIFLKNKVTTMDADPLSPCAAKASAAMVLNVGNKQIIALTIEYTNIFQVEYNYISFQTRKLIWLWPLFPKILLILTLIGCFQTLTPVSIHRWLWNDAQSLK